jgi:Asp/Glu/hydantoin racemase
VAAPILKIDDPLAERAVELGPRIGILCTTSSTQGPSRALVESHAGRLRREVQARSVLVEGAFDALRSGDRERHDALISDAAASLAGQSDVLVLAQASMAHLAGPLAERLPVPVLSSPPLLMEALVRLQADPGEPPRS